MIGKHKQGFMESITIHVARAFCRDGQGGNLAGVVLSTPTSLTPGQKQIIAKTLNFSETVFLEKKASCEYSATYYTPSTVIDFCGHATVAAFSLLRLEETVEDKPIALSTTAGPCTVSFDGDLVFVSQQKPIFGEQIAIAEIAPMLGLSAGDFTESEMTPQIVSTGLKDILFPVRDQDTLASIKPNFPAIKKLSEKYDIVGMHVFSLNPGNSTVAARCRNFAPRYDIPEESATGSSNGALACYLHKIGKVAEGHLLFQQGDALNLPSDIHVKLSVNKDGTMSVSCGGKVVLDEVREMKY